MSRPFARHLERKALRSPRRIATINGRPAWEVVAERKAAAYPDAQPAPADRVIGAGLGRLAALKSQDTTHE